MTKPTEPFIHSPGLRPGKTGVPEPFSLLRFGVIVIVVAFFLYWFIREVFEYYPGDDPELQEAGNPKRLSLYRKLKEGFEGVKVANLLVKEPQPGNIERNPDVNIVNETTPFNPNDKSSYQSKNIDTDILRSQRYYNSVYQPLLTGESKNDTKGVTFRIPSLQQEIPSTYMINILNQVRDNQPEFQIPKQALKHKIQDELLHYQPDGEKYYYKTPLYTFPNLGKLETYQLDREPFFLELFTTLKLYLMTKINLLVLDEKLSHQAHPFQFFNIIQSQHLKLESIPKVDKEGNILETQSLPNFQLIFNLVVHRDYKPYTFNIQTKLLVDLYSNPDEIMVSIQDLELLGSTMDGNQESPLYSRIDNPKGVNLSKSVGNGGLINAPVSDFRESIPGMGITTSNFDFVNINEEKIKKAETNKRTQDNEGWNTLNVGFMDTVSKEYANTYLQQRREKRQELYPDSTFTIYNQGGERSKDTDKETINDFKKVKYSPNPYGDYQCFQFDFNSLKPVIDKEANDPIKCKSYNPKYSRVGVWDTKCIEDTECPFYKPDAFPGEENYGCDRIVPIQDDKGGIAGIEKGYCSMPPGIVPISYRKYLKDELVSTQQVS